jgi:hypothetical protein
MPARNLVQRALAERHERSVQRCSTRIGELVRRIQRDYVQRPELRLTLEEAQLLWQLERTECEALLTALVDAAFLRRVGGAFMRARSATVVV